MRFDLSKIRGVSISSFDMEEMTGRDSLDAAARALGPSPSAKASAQQLNVLHRNELVAQSISAVDGRAVIRPFVQWGDWSLRTQEFVMRAYSRLNEATEEEVESFIKAHFDAPSEATEPTISGSGSTSPGIYEGPVYPQMTG
jgi:hypothetical protein